MYLPTLESARSRFCPPRPEDASSRVPHVRGRRGRTGAGHPSPCSVAFSYSNRNGPSGVRAAGGPVGLKVRWWLSSHSLNTGLGTNRELLRRPVLKAPPRTTTGAALFRVGRFGQFWVWSGGAEREPGGWSSGGSGLGW